MLWEDIDFVAAKNSLVWIQLTKKFRDISSLEKMEIKT